MSDEAPEAQHEDKEPPHEGAGLVGPDLSKEQVDEANQHVHPSDAARDEGAPVGDVTQNGPAAGVDPAVEVTEHDDATAEQAMEEPTVGPAQTPVLRPTAHAADPDAMRWNAENTDQPAPSTEVGELPEHEHKHLAQMIREAYEQLAHRVWTDGFGRVWSATYGPVNNQAAVTVAVQKDDGTRNVSIISGCGLAVDTEAEDAVDQPHETVAGLHELAK